MYLPNEHSLLSNHHNVYNSSKEGLQPSQRTSPTMRRSCQIPSLTRFTRLHVNSCPAAIEWAQVLEPDNMWLPPHCQNFIAATLAREKPSMLLRFLDNGLSFLATSCFYHLSKRRKSLQGKHASPTTGIMEDKNFSFAGYLLL